MSSHPVLGVKHGQIPATRTASEHPSNDADYWEPDYERRPARSEYDELRRDDNNQRIADMRRELK